MHVNNFVVVTNTGALPNVTPGSPLVLNCLTTSGIITASSSTSGVNYSWSGPGITAGASTASPTVNEAGTYTVTVTNPSNGCSNTATVTVTNMRTPTVAVGSSLALNCLVSSGLIELAPQQAVLLMYGQVQELFQDLQHLLLLLMELELILWL